jgi:hypothetical protein
MAVPDAQQELKEMNIEEVEVIQPKSPITKGETSFNVKETREDTRGRLATYFVIGFFSILILTSLLAFFAPAIEGQSSIDNLRESILTVSGVLSGPLGFIIGFYFRKLEDE